MRTVRYHDRAVLVVKRAEETFTLAERPAPILKTFDRYPVMVFQDPEFAEFAAGDLDIESTFVGHEPQLAFELVFIAVSGHIVLPVAHTRRDRATDRDVVCKFENPLVIRIFFSKYIQALFGDLDQLFSRTQLAFDQFFIDKFEDLFRGGLLADNEFGSEFTGGYRDELVDSAFQSEFFENGDVH